MWKVTATFTLLQLLTSANCSQDKKAKVCSPHSARWQDVETKFPDCYYYADGFSWIDAEKDCKKRVTNDEIAHTHLITRENKTEITWVVFSLWGLPHGLGNWYYFWVGAQCKTQHHIEASDGSWTSADFDDACPGCVTLVHNSNSRWFTIRKCTDHTFAAICQSRKVCPGGYEPIENNVLECGKCNTYSFKKALNNQKCSSCPQHQKGNSDRTSCIDICYPGKYRKNPDDLACTDCPRGHYKIGNGDNSCTECGSCSTLGKCSKKTTAKLGSVHSDDCYDEQCKHGNVLDIRTGDCKACGSGTSTRQREGADIRYVSCEGPRSNEELHKPTKKFRCKAGYYRAGSDVFSPCEACGEHTYKSWPGDDKCIVCPDNQDTDKKGSTACLCKPDYGLNTAGDCDYCKTKDMVKEYLGNGSCSQCVGHTEFDKKTMSCVCIAGYGVKDIGDDHCIICKQGWYKASRGNEKCTKCDDKKPKTKNKGSTDEKECTNFACAKGKELDPETRICTQCTGETAKMTSDLEPCVEAGYGEVWISVVSIVCAGGFERPDGGACQLCDGDREYKNISGDKGCINCPTNYFPVPSKTYCIAECKPGYYRDQDTRQCVECGRNTYKIGYGEGPCSGCPLERPYINKTGSSDRNDCTQLAENCGQGEDLHPVSKECRACDHGLGKDFNEDRCRRPGEGEVVLPGHVFGCEEGYGLKEEKCKECDIHFYKKGKEKRMCRECPGKRPHTEEKGTKTKRDCTNLFCLPGFTRNDDKECVKCGHGLGKATNDTSDCKPPSEGEGITADQDAFYCLAGFFRNEKTTKCEKCPIGTYTAKTSNNATCESCGLNEGTGEKQRKRCLCKPGFERIKRKCSACNAGFYKDKLGDMRCSKCDSAKERGSSTCDDESKLPMILGIVGAIVVALAVIIGFSVVCYKRHATEDTDAALERASDMALKMVDTLVNLYPIKVPSFGGNSELEDESDYSGSDTSYTTSLSSGSYTDISDTSFSDTSMTEDAGTTKLKDKRRRGRGSRHARSRHARSRHARSSHHGSRHTRSSHHGSRHTRSSHHGSRHTRSSDRTISLSQSARKSRVYDEADEIYGEDGDDVVTTESHSELTFSHANQDE